MPADEHSKVLGIWRLLSCELEYQETGEHRPALGKNPQGYIIFTSEGRFMALLTGGGRKAPDTDREWAKLMISMSAYSGMYRLEGDRWITKVDVSWHPAWVGTEQVRFFRIEGDRLFVTSEWEQSVIQPEKGTSRFILTFERAK